MSIAHIMSASGLGLQKTGDWGENVCPQGNVFEKTFLAATLKKETHPAPITETLHDLLQVLIK
jgi:hypothetical protein